MRKQPQELRAQTQTMPLSLCREQQDGMPGAMTSRNAAHRGTDMSWGSSRRNRTAPALCRHSKASRAAVNIVLVAGPWRCRHDKRAGHRWRDTACSITPWAELACRLPQEYPLHFRKRPATCWVPRDLSARATDPAAQCTPFPIHPCLQVGLAGIALSASRAQLITKHHAPKQRYIVDKGAGCVQHIQQHHALALAAYN